MDLNTISAPLVLIVEDEESYVDALQVGLEREGFRIRVARDGRDGLDQFTKYRPDLVLLDVMLPGLSGMDVCKAIRATGDTTPIIMVTARDSEVDVVLGLEFGADDYVSKPYRMRELVARIRAGLRRQNVATGGGPRELPLKQIGDVQLDPERHEVRLRGEVVSVPRKEFELLELMMDRAGRVVSRDFAIEQVWGDDYVGDTKTLDVHINRLRGRLEEDPARPVRIVTVRGIGYRFELPR
jgi:two-component system, OmpR family, response regulator RegX3